MSQTFVEQLSSQIMRDAQEVQTELQKKAKSKEAIEALQQVARSTPGIISQFTRICDANDGIANKDQLEATIDSTLGDVLRISGSAFEGFCKGENFGDQETFTLLREYRTEMLTRLGKIFQKTVD